MKNSRILALAGALGALLSFAPIARACSCMAPPAPKIALQQSAAVFVGHVASVKQLDNSKRFTFDVSQKWKGVKGAQVAVVTPDNSAACGLNFDADRDYLVYAFQNKEDAELRVNLCTRTARLEDAAADVAELGAPLTDAVTAPPTTQDAAQGHETQFQVSDIAQLPDALRAKLKVQFFRISWPVVGTNAVTALYDRANSTLKFYSKLHGEYSTIVKTSQYEGVTDKILAQWAGTYKSSDALDKLTAYGAAKTQSRSQVSGYVLNRR